MSQALICIAQTTKYTVGTKYTISGLQGVTPVGGKYITEKGTDFKLRGIIQIKFSNFAVFSALITINNYCYDTQLHVSIDGVYINLVNVRL